MKVDKQEIRIIPATHDAAGEKLEPEQRPAEIVLHTSGTIQLGSDPRKVDVGAGVHIPGMVTVDAFAGDLADAARNRCADCAHFDREAWIALYKKWRVGTYAEQQQLNSLREAADHVNDEDYRDKHQDPDGELDTEHAIQALGVCHALTDYWSKIKGEFDPQLFDPACGCPDTFGPDNTYLGRCFKPRDAAAKKRGAKGYDQILQAAAGRSPVIKPGK